MCDFLNSACLAWHIVVADKLACTSSKNEDIDFYGTYSKLFLWLTNLKLLIYFYLPFKRHLLLFCV